eukprot:CAMPEP_0184872584 /NCGR_PEP_ID=MMETSP0580-20130426/41373_1 /TAXON_ID=1118495 /ORGANISM="Dactyliosolen fragilissimus" /LENGTH=158 /DNA_ID=CAMNT_0027375407 /DNA_START=483 /DNA_END=959 /DNA_ORIENTATION=+
MARSRRGGGRSGGSLFGSRKPAPKPQTRSASSVPATRPAPAPPAVQQQQSGGMLSGIGSTIAQGMAFGTGSAIAHRAVGAAAGALSGGGSADEMPREEMVTGVPLQQHDQSLQGACAQDKQMFFECLKVNQGDQQSCSFLYETLQTCQRNESQMSFQG